MGGITLSGADGIVDVRGTYKSITDNRTGAPTLTITGAIKGSDVADILVDTAEIGAAGIGLTEAGGDGDHLVEAGGTGDQLTAINLPNQTMDIIGDITGNLSGSIGSNTELGPAEVNAEIVDVMKTDTMTQSTLCPQEAPPVNATIEEAIAYLYKAWRNRSTQTADTYSLYADNTTTQDQKATVSDNATIADKGEVVAGT